MRYIAIAGMALSLLIPVSAQAALTIEQANQLSYLLSLTAGSTTTSSSGAAASSSQPVSSLILRAIQNAPSAPFSFTDLYATSSATSTVSTTTAQVQALELQIVQLQGQLAALIRDRALGISHSATTSQPQTVTQASAVPIDPENVVLAEAVCPSITHILMKNMEGDEVLSLQNYFVRVHLMNAANATGYFGVLTEGALKVWQRAQGLDPVGMTGPKTRELLLDC